ncbi:MAG: ABC transporter permease subunit [Bacillota bacterium]
MANKYVDPFLLKKELLENWSKYLLGSLMLGLTAVCSAFLYGTNGGLTPLLPGITGSPALEPAAYTLYIANRWGAGTLPQLGAVVAIVLGMGSFSLERARGTLLFLLNTPLTRETIFRTKTCAGLLLLCGSLLVSVLVLCLTSRLLGYSLAAGPFTAGFFLTLAGLFFIFQLTIFFSVLSADPVKAGVASAFCCFLLYSAGLFNKTRFLSPFYYMGGGTYLQGGPYPWLYLLIILAATFILYSLGRRFWHRLEV